MVFRELSFSRLECGVHDRLHIYPLCGIFYFPWHRHQIEGTNGFYCLIRKTERFTISNVERQVFTPNNSRLDPGSNPGCPRDKRMSYHWTNCASLKPTMVPSTEHSRGNSVCARFQIIFAYKNVQGRTDMRTRERKECQSIRTVLDISGDDRAIIMTCSLRTATDK